MRLFLFILWLAIAGTVPASAAQDDQRLDKLFELLQNAKSPQEARVIEESIWKIWLHADREFLNTLMRQGTKAMSDKDFELAAESFNALVELAPDMAEAWNKRATMYYLQGNYKASIADVQRTLELEPRHFGALTGLGLMYEALGEKGAALKAFKEGLKYNPQMQGIREKVKHLTVEVEGSKI